MPGSKPPLVSRPPHRGVLAARRVPIFGFPSKIFDGPAPIHSRRARPLRAGCGSRRPARCVPLFAFRPLDLLCETCTLRTLRERALRRALWCRRGVSRGRGVFVLHLSTWGVSMSAPGVDVARGHRGAGFPCRPDTEDLALVDGRGDPPAAPRCAECLGGPRWVCLLHIHTANLCTI